MEQCFGLNSWLFPKAGVETKVLVVIFYEKVIGTWICEMFENSKPRIVMKMFPKISVLSVFQVLDCILEYSYFRNPILETFRFPEPFLDIFQLARTVSGNLSCFQILIQKFPVLGIHLGNCRVSGMHFRNFPVSEMHSWIDSSSGHMETRILVSGTLIPIILFPLQKLWSEIMVTLTPHQSWKTVINENLWTTFIKY